MENDNKLHRDDIKEVTMTTDAGTNSAIIGLVRNGNTEAGAPVTGAITVTSGGGTGGSDTFVKISNGTANQTFATGSKVEAIGTNDATTGIKINGQEYTIKDNDTQYTAGDNVAIDTNNKISVDLSQYAKTVDVAVVYNDKNSLHSTNSGKVGEKAIAFGRNTIADGKFSVAIGDGANVDANGVYESSGNYSTAVGAASGAWGTQSTAVGYNAKTQGQNAVAFGFSASASGKDTVAIGANSVANREAGAVGLYAPTGNSSSTWKATSGAVSIGSSTKTRQIINLAAGTADTDAVNVAQLKKVKAEADKHTTLVAGANVTLDKKETENGLALKKQLTGMESIQGAGEGKISFDGANVKVNNTTFSENSVVVGGGTDGKTPVTINGTDGVVSGLHNTNIGYTDFATKGNAATEEQLKKVMDAGWKFTTDSNQETTVKVGPDGTNANAVTFKGDSANVEVTNTGNNIKVALKNDLTVDSVKAGSSFMSATGIGYGDKAYITSSGLNANGQTITNVKAGEAETDAVNVGQLNAVKAEASKKTTLSDGKNTTVTSVTTDGQTDYQVNVAGDLKDITSVSNGASKINLNADSISISNANKSFAITNSGIGMSYIGADYTAKSIMLGENGTTISGGLNVAGSKITGVAAGTADTDAVNVSQLNKVSEIANKGWKLKTNNGNVSDVKPGDEVEFDGDDNIKVSNAGNKVSFKLNNKLTGIESITGVGGGSISFSGGNVTINNNVTFGSNGQIHNVTAGTASTDAVNVGQLNAAVQAGNTDTHIKPGEYGVGADNKVNMDVVDKTGTKINTVTITDVAKASDLGNVNNINNDLKNSNGTTTVVDAVNNLNQKLDNKVGDLQYSKVDKGDIADGDSTTTAIGKLDQKLNDVAATAAKQHTTVSGSGNIVVEDPTINADGGKNYNVKLADDINVNSVTANTFKADKTIMDKDGLKVGEKVSVTENAVTAGKTSISDEGVKVGDKTYISDKGLNANGQNITNVADGKVEKDSKDAINGGQLFDTETKINNRIDGVENQVISNSNRIGQLSSRVNKVGAGAAALAALHPMDFDPDDKLTFSAGYGNYAGQNAAAIGAYYRPDEKVMFSVGGTVGNGENMVNAGISFSLDRTNHVSNSRTALAREVIDLRGQLAEMGAKMAKMEKAFGMLDESKTKLFPDIPANHWAYEYIAKLAGNGYIEGYPDGNFGGDRLMTRYEFAAMLYRAIENGAALEEKIIKEFEPELGRIRVDRISGEDGDRDKIERVRVNDTKGERDHYGNKLAK